MKDSFVFSLSLIEVAYHNEATPFIYVWIDFREAALFLDTLKKYAIP